MRRALLPLLLACLTCTCTSALGQGPAADGAQVIATEQLDGLLRADGEATTLEVVLPVDTSRRWPLVLFVHGWSARPVHYDGLVRNLASRGFAVAEFDQVDTFELDLRLWVAAAVGAIDALEAASADPDNALFDRLDMDRLAVVGHSYGGATTTCLAASDPRVKVAVALAPGVNELVRPFLMAHASRVQIPILVLGSEFDPVVRPSRYARPVFESLPSPKRLYVELARGEHGNFTDVNLGYWVYRPLSYGGWVKTMDADQMRDLSRGYTNAWLEHHLGVQADTDGYTDGRAAERDHAAGKLSRYGVERIQH